MTIPVKKISTFCKTGSGGTPSRSNNAFFENGTIPWVKSGELKNRYITEVEEYITDLAVEKSSAKLVSKGSLLIAMYGATVGEVSQLTFDATTNQAICNIQPDENVCDVNYLYRFLEASKSYLLSRRVGGGQPNISQSVIKDLDVPLPPLAEQRRIASILDQADELRQKRQQAIEKLDQLLQATFIEMFGDPVSNPKGWQIEPLKNNILHANNGLSRRRKELENVGDIVLRLQDVHYDGIHFDKELNRISLDDSEKKRFSVDEGDILFIRVNGNPEYVGRSAVFSGYKEPIFHNDHLIRIKLSERYIPNFLSYCFNTPQGKNIISKQIKTSAGQHTVSQGGIEIMKFYIPPIKLQEQWTNLYLKIEDQKKKLNEQLDMQNQLFSSLQNQAFNGTL